MITLYQQYVNRFHNAEQPGKPLTEAEFVDVRQRWVGDYHKLWDKLQAASSLENPIGDPEAWAEIQELERLLIV